MKASIDYLKQMDDDYKLLENVRFEFIDKHEKVSDGVYATTYSNGTKITVDYNNETFEIDE